MALADIPPQPASDHPVPRLLAAATELADADLDGLSDHALEEELTILEEIRRRTEARQCRVADALRSRRATRLREAGADRSRAERRAERDTADQLAGTLHWSRADANRATRLGRQLHSAPQAASQFDGGKLSPRHAQLLTDTLRHLVGEERTRAEARLLQHARTEDAVTFGQTCRRLLAQLDHEAAMADEDRRHSRRSARMTQTDDGMLAVSAQLAGLDAEQFATAVHAFRRPNTPGEARSAEQATADAMAEMASAALRAGEAPTVHGVRPHVTVDVNYQTILDQAGVAETVWAGPLPFGEARRLLADCGVSRLLVDRDELPLEAGPEVRSVPVGLYRGLLRRDGGCIASGCDAPAAWCDVMHLDQPYRFEGRLSLDNAALGCRTHHRHFDRGPWEVTWVDRRPILHPPARPPRGRGRDPGPRGRDPDTGPGSGDPNARDSGRRPPATPGPPGDESPSNRDGPAGHGRADVLELPGIGRPETAVRPPPGR